MNELDSVQKIELSKYLMKVLTEGDWQELLILTGLEKKYNWNQLYKDVHWGNDSLKSSCISAVNVVLDNSPDNLNHVWNLDAVQSSLKSENPKLYEVIKNIVNEEALKTVVIPTLLHISKNVFQALNEAELLIEKAGAASAYDRMHTALHGFLQTVCDKNNIQYGSLESITALLPKINALIKSKVIDDGRNEKVFMMLRSVGAILENINYLRNNHCMSHPTENLLNENDARFAINLARSMMSYIDSLLETI